ncbi:hypothetical protein Tco_0086209 [Tanacetum coccineum]
MMMSDVAGRDGGWLRRDWVYGTDIWGGWVVSGTRMGGLDGGCRVYVVVQILSCGSDDTLESAQSGRLGYRRRRWVDGETVAVGGCNHSRLTDEGGDIVHSDGRGITLLKGLDVLLCQNHETVERNLYWGVWSEWT